VHTKKVVCLVLLLCSVVPCLAYETNSCLCLHVPQTIIEQIKHCVMLRRHSRSHCSITLSDVRNSLHLSENNKERLEKIIKIGGAGSIHLD